MYIYLNPQASDLPRSMHRQDCSFVSPEPRVSSPIATPERSQGHMTPVRWKWVLLLNSQLYEKQKRKQATAGTNSHQNQQQQNSGRKAHLHWKSYKSACKLTHHIGAWVRRSSGKTIALFSEPDGLQILSQIMYTRALRCPLLQNPQQVVHLGLLLRQSFI